MTQFQWQLLASKVTVLAAIVSLTGWLVIYTNLAEWWLDHLGRTFAFKTIILVLLLALTVPGMFWTLTHLETDALDWAEIALVGLITPVLIWRSAAFLNASDGHTWYKRWRSRRKTP